jgi:outer membrane lipoprotein SlyB
MTRKLITLSALALTLVLTMGCSSVPNQPAYGEVGTPHPSAAYPTSGAYEQYGYVRNIQQLEVTRRPSGGGALLGAVIGGVVGNQFGSGSGRTAATGVGAVAGAVVGNQIENRNQTSAGYYYQIDVRMDNGDVRTFDYQDLNGLRVGDRVRLVDGPQQRW